MHSTYRTSPKMRETPGFEMKGIILLIICGIYALVMFLLASLIGYGISKVTVTARSVNFRVGFTDNVDPMFSDKNNNDRKPRSIKCG